MLRLRLSPDLAVLGITLGLLLIFLELNRPGRILPGSLGLLLVLMASSSLSRNPLRLSAVCLLLASASLLLLNLKFRLPAVLLALAALGFGAGFLLLTPGTVHAWVALPCGLVLGGSGAVLSRIALRARQAKRIN